MAAYHADDIRNLKKMIGFIEEHTVSIGEEELKKEIFALEFEALLEEEDILHTLFTPFSKFCDEWRFEESEKDAETALIEKVKAEWEEKTIYDWDGNVTMEKLMKKFDENHEETE